MLREKYLDFLNFISNDLSKLGFVKKRKKEVFYCEINNKIKKIEFIMIKRRDIGEIVVNVSVEYPKLNELITKVTYHNFKRNNIFSTYICNLPDVNQTSDFVFCDDTNMAYLSEMVAVLLENKVIPYLMEFDNDITIIKMFEYNNRIMSALYSSKGKLVTDYYLIWAGLCILNNLCCEATMIMHHAMSKVEESDIKGYLTEIEELTKCREQKNAWYLKTPKEEIFIDPSIKEIKEFLYALDGKVHSYIIIVNSITHNYIQIAGASGEFIVEVREHNGNDYKHYRYKKKTEDNSKRNLPFQGGFMQVRVNEIVNFKEILKVLNYLNNEYIISENYWEDITDNI